MGPQSSEKFAFFLFNFCWATLCTRHSTEWWRHQCVCVCVFGHLHAYLPNHNTNNSMTKCWVCNQMVWMKGENTIFPNTYAQTHTHAQNDNNYDDDDNQTIYHKTNTSNFLCHGKWFVIRIAHISFHFMLFTSLHARCVQKQAPKRKNKTKTADKWINKQWPHEWYVHIDYFTSCLLSFSTFYMTRVMHVWEFICASRNENIRFLLA